MPRTKKKIADTSLELSEKQLQYLQSDGATIVRTRRHYRRIQSLVETTAVSHS